ncbi:Up-regulated in Daf-2 domain-containing protein [Caenorhabditis elegans]|uniref:Up-regulated in Daf-2 domain-containing protein n=1 Tax=Caenorhabditis elegans TaxID=6239 RepID=Q4R163_CAEEL|nr:Up-regulated in Daf-2 domain-containing protein [Caenorhabditis elegans]CCD83531.1 Up-regulated in Daf-2 domain-containing protein [Caenorhabditis elegans]|eukprot:NP_001033446.1 PUD-Like protein [Caenorhabditis elegans]
MATRRTASVDLENCTGSYFRLQVLHQYTNEGTDDSGLLDFKPGEKKRVFDSVQYYTGFFTTGCDNWKVDGIRLHEVTTDSKTVQAMIGGKAFVEGLPYKSGHGFGAQWKKHTLRAEDRDRATLIKVFQTEVQFISPSGVSTTTFDTVGQNVLGLGVQ